MGKESKMTMLVTFHDERFEITHTDMAKEVIGCGGRTTN
jgi:hypothetical protein